MGDEPVLFVKAQRRGAALVMDDMFAPLFEKVVDVRGYTKQSGEVVKPHRQTRKVKLDEPKGPTQKVGEGDAGGPRNSGGMGRDISAQVRPADTAEQPYQSDGIKLSRGSLTVRPAANQLPGVLSTHLRPHAQDAVNLALEKFKAGARSFLISDGTGAGKTRQALALAEMVKASGPVLIVTQNARVVSDAFAKDAATMGVAIKAVDSKAEMTGPGIYVTTYTRVGRGDFDGATAATVMFDEAHNLKNYDAAKTTKAMDLFKGAKRSVLLTATPADKAIHVGYLATAFGFSFFKAMAALGYKKGEYGYELQHGVTRDAAAMRMGSLFDALTREGLMVKREVSMDNLSVATTRLELTDAQSKEMASAHSNLLHQAANAHPRRRGLIKMLGLAKLRTALEPYKIDATVDAATKDARAGKKVVIFANRIADADLPSWWPGGAVDEGSAGTLDDLAGRLEAKGLKVGRMYGKFLSKAEGTIAGFQTGDTDVVVATPQAGGTGINLDDTVGDKPRSMIVMTAPFSSLEAVQMIGRVNRLTTKSNASVRFIQAAGVGVDEWNFGIIKTKLKMLGASVQGDVAKLDLSKLGHLADEDLERVVSGESVPVNEGPVITMADLGLGTKPAGKARTGARTNLRVPFAEKDEAKRYGARWDAAARTWYVLGDVPDELQKWAGGSAVPEKKAGARTDLHVPFAEKDKAKALGARWDAAAKLWYVTGDVPDGLKKYLSGGVTEKAAPMTAAQVQATQDALVSVLAACDGAARLDGAGFNRFDAMRAREFASFGGEWTDSMARAARRMMWKYKGQIGPTLAERMGRPEEPLSKAILFLPEGCACPA